jgi:hypothetical protein
MTAKPVMSRVRDGSPTGLRSHSSWGRLRSLTLRLTGRWTQCHSLGRGRSRWGRLYFFLNGDWSDARGRGAVNGLEVGVHKDASVMTLRVNSGCNKRQRLESNKAKSKLVKCKEYRVLLCYL